MDRLTEKAYGIAQTVEARTEYNGKVCYKTCEDICKAEKNKCNEGCPIQGVISRLAAYEDTGLTPGEIPHWIPVSEPPKKEQWCHVAVKTKNGYRVENDLFAVETAEHFGHEHGFCKRDVAYWMPLPKAPKEAPNA